MDRHRLLRGVTSGGATSTSDTIELSHSAANHGSNNNEAECDGQRGNRATERGKARCHHNGGTTKKPANASVTAVHMERYAINANWSVAKARKS